MSLSLLLPILESNNSQLTGLLSELELLAENGILHKQGINVDPVFVSRMRALHTNLQAQINTATRPFTLAVVGEFKAGKSTLLNALLGLHGEARLPTGVPPSTAKSIIISYRDEGMPSARIKWQDGTEEDTEWARARNLIDHIWLEKHPEDMSTSERISDVTYFLKDPILTRLCLNDLPGPGAKNIRDTEVAYDKMKQADAIIWCIGEVPTDTDVSFLNALSETSLKVIPIINIHEDIPNRISRNDNKIKDIRDTVLKDFRQYFSSEFTEPLMVSAKMIEYERAKETPDEIMYEKYGFTGMLKVIQGFQQQAIDPEQSHRIRRIKGVSINLIEKLVSTSSLLEQDLKKELIKLESARGSNEDRIIEISNITDLLRSEIRTLAKNTATELCRIVAGHAKAFVGDVLQVSNLPDLYAALTKSRTTMEKMLQERFEKEYLLLDKKPNWLDSLCNNFAEEVRAVIIPEWRAFWSRLSDEEIQRIELAHPGLTFNSLSDSLIKAMIDVVMRVVSILGIAGVLAAVPGGQIIDAVGVVGVIILSLIKDPLESSRRRAINSVELQTDSLSYDIRDNLLNAGMEGNSVIANKIRDIVLLDIDITDKAKTTLSDLTNHVSMYVENAREHIEALKGKK